MSICPKNKSSKARRDKRRANWKMSAPNLVNYFMLVIGNYSVMFRNCYKILCSAKRFAGQRGQ